MSCPEGSRAFAISASSPSAGVAHGCRSAVPCWRSNLPRLRQPLQPHLSCGSALVVRGPCASSNGSPRSNFGRRFLLLTALNARSFARSRWAFGYAFLDVCLYTRSRTRGTCLPPWCCAHRSPRISSVPGVFGKNRHSKPIARSLVRAAPAASFLRLYPKRPDPRLVSLLEGSPPGRFR